MGIILYTILFGRYPFNSNDPDYPRLVVNAQYVMPEDIVVRLCLPVCCTAPASLTSQTLVTAMRAGWLSKRPAQPPPA